MVEYRSVKGVFNYVTGRDAKVILQNSVSGVIFAIGASIVGGIIELADLFINPVDAIGEVLVTAAQAFVLTPLEVLIQSATATKISLGPGGSFDLGPLTILVGLVVVLAFAWILTSYLEREGSSNFLPFAPYDIVPGIFREENDQE